MKFLYQRPVAIPYVRRISKMYLNKRKVRSAISATADSTQEVCHWHWHQRRIYCPM